MEKATGCTTLYLRLLSFFFVFSHVAAADDSLMTTCAPEFQKVTLCLPFVTEKSTLPTKECCDTVVELKNTKPVCMCFFVQQIHNGTNEATKSLGIKESQLLRLPAACKVVNATAANCPRLLNLPENPSDAAIFADPPPSGAAAATVSGSGTAANEAFWEKPQVVFVAGISFLIQSLAATRPGMYL